VTGVLVALLIPVGVLCVVNLAFSLAVVRRLREHTETIARLSRQVGGAPPESGLAPGTPVPALEATAEDGAPLTTDPAGTGETLLAFVSATCPACRTHLPDFVRVARAGYNRGNVVVVVSGERADAQDLLDIAVPETRVVVEPDFGPFTTGFDIQAFPTFLRVHDGVVAARGLAVSEVAEPVRV
jgi:thiol-disulfide isomerase/thioredoxin